MQASMVKCLVGEQPSKARKRLSAPIDTGAEIVSPGALRQQHEGQLLSSHNNWGPRCLHTPCIVVLALVRRFSHSEENQPTYICRRFLGSVHTVIHATDLRRFLGTAATKFSPTHHPS